MPRAASSTAPIAPPPDGTRLIFGGRAARFDGPEALRVEMRETTLAMIAADFERDMRAVAVDETG